MEMHLVKCSVMLSESRMDVAMDYLMALQLVLMMDAHLGIE